ncbi:MAG: DNA mismatch repair endonuclease MutL [Lachnospiraceae bacterium]|nr:DNA mismatch repair endonuclease MutL [Lachnospiraceae bacterium]
MGNIKLLDQKTINQIAAGEVIDRPASVVKELMENAIDAGASMITVEIKDGGTSLIRITDNGGGIAKEDIKTAFLRHSTSKIKSVEDLITVSSLGFRGEALSSIAAVCQVELITKVKDSITASRYIIEGGSEKSLEEIGAPDGTTFIVKNIFYNTPARRKFLKSPQTEAGYISDVVEHIAMSHPEVAISFISNNKERIHTQGNENLRDVIYSVYGKETAKNLLEIGNTNDEYEITGYLGKPIINRGNRNGENYFINGRYIKSNIVSKAIEEAYKPYVMQHKYPFVVLHFKIDSSMLDVNVHPSKMQLRFKDGDKVYEFIRDSVSNTLRRISMIPNVEIDERTKEEKSSNKSVNIKPAQPFEQKRIEIEKRVSTPPLTVSTPAKVILNVEKKPEPAANNINVIKPNNVEIHRQNVENNVDNTENGLHKNTHKSGYNTETEKPVDIINEESIYNINNKAENMSFFDEDFLSEKARPKHKIIGQVFDTYWIVEYDGKMYIIDQHAAHEKVMYEMLMERFRKKERASQNLNPPIIVSLSMNEEAMLNHYIDMFYEFGFEIEPFGGREYAIRAVPLDLYTLNERELFIDMLDNLSLENNKVSSELLSDRIATMSCKAAVKGNNTLSYAEADELIDKLLSLDNPYNCPHGRPTIISMSKYELEKKFKRII